MSAPALFLTPYERLIRDADGGFGHRLAGDLERAAADLRLMTEPLMPTIVNTYLYATTGSDEERRAAVDAWAARHHVPAGWSETSGWYCARVATDTMTVMAIAVSESEFPAPRDGSPLRGVAA